MSEPNTSVPMRTWPKVPKLQIPTNFGNHGPHQRPPSTTGSIHSNPLYIPMYAGYNQPMTPGTGLPKNNPYYNPFVNPGKASEYMFKQFEGFKDFTMNTAKSGLSVGEKSAFWMYNKVSTWSKKWFTHIFLFLVILVYTAAGAAMFVAIEGAHENKIKADTRKEKNEFVKEFTEIMRHNVTLIEDPQQWEGEVNHWMGIFESRLEVWIKQDSNRDNKVWTFWNAVFYCGTIYTTIGYGHIAPSTTTGRAITIVYAIFGIPLFLILLADFGKLFTRGIKFLWVFVRRLYYTGSCRKVRTTVPVQEVMKGLNLVYEAASTFRRPSQYAVNEVIDPDQPPKLPPKPKSTSSNLLSVPDGSEKHEPLENDEPQTPALSVFEIDDEFNLPISVAIFILIGYIFVGASVYVFWEEWGFFESFYFVFISMSTIGFGDYVPNHPMYMMLSIVYLVFGLALTSMCINVVQAKLSDSFRQASAKIGATIGLKVSEEDGSLAPVTPPPVEMPPVHATQKTPEIEEAPSK